MGQSSHHRHRVEGGKPAGLVQNDNAVHESSFPGIHEGNVKIFGPAFFKRLVGFGATPQGLPGAAAKQSRTADPTLPKADRPRAGPSAEITSSTCRFWFFSSKYHPVLIVGKTGYRLATRAPVFLAFLWLTPLRPHLFEKRRPKNFYTAVSCASLTPITGNSQLAVRDLLPGVQPKRATFTGPLSAQTRVHGQTSAGLSPPPKVRPAWGATPADCASVVPHEESKRSARPRVLPGVQPPRQLADIQRRRRALSSYTGAAFSRRPKVRPAWGATP